MEERRVQESYSRAILPHVSQLGIDQLGYVSTERELDHIPSHASLALLRKVDETVGVTKTSPQKFTVDLGANSLLGKAEKYTGFTKDVMDRSRSP